MVRTQLVVLALVVAFSGSNAEARGRRAMRQPTYQQFYNVMTPAAVAAPAMTVQTSPVVQSGDTTSASTIVQTNATAPANEVVQASATGSASTAAPATSTPAAPKVAAYGSAQWKAEQSARIGSVQHLGGGFGGGSHEGNGFGATADQAIRNACYWGQLTPIEIGVARGANGYYATIFYR